MVGLRPGVFLDRDGVLNANAVRNGRPYAPTALADFHLYPGVPGAVARLKAAGFLIVVVTNQPDVATGLTPRGVVERMHDRLREEVPVDDIKICYHTDADRCDCRKPAPGMLLAAARELGVDLQRSYMVGDRWRDVDAGKAAGCMTVFIDHGYRSEPNPDGPDAIVSDLVQATEWILQRQKGACK